MGLDLFGFPTKRDSNKSPQLQGLARKLEIDKANNKGAEQTAQMRRLVSAYVFRKPPKTVFSRRGPYVRKPLELNNLCVSITAEYGATIRLVR